MSNYSDKNIKEEVKEEMKETKEVKKVRHMSADEIFTEEAAQIDAVLKEFDKESNTRLFDGVPRSIIKYMLVAFSLYALWMNVFSTLPEQVRRASFIGIVVFLHRQF